MLDPCATLILERFGAEPPRARRRFSFGGTMRLRCPECHATLCEYATGNVVIRHRGRLIVVACTALRALQCWQCGAVLDGERVRALVTTQGVEHGTSA